MLGSEHKCAFTANVLCVFRWFSFYSSLFTTALTIGLLATWFMPKLWEVSAGIAARFGYNRSHEVLITVIYNLLDAGKDILLAMPFSLYSTFVVEQRHGFNKQTVAIFIKDQVIGVSWHYWSTCSTFEHLHSNNLKTTHTTWPPTMACMWSINVCLTNAMLALTPQRPHCIVPPICMSSSRSHLGCAIGVSFLGATFHMLQVALGLVFLPPIIAAITLILKNTGPLVALYLWFFILVVSLFMMTIYPVVIAPLFNKFTPLPEGSLRYD